MKNNKRRGILAAGWAVLATLALAVGGTAAQADTTRQVPDETPVTITKLEQPESLGTPATGAPLRTEGLEPIGGVVFHYYLVDGTQSGGANDAGTNAGQVYAANLDVAAVVANRPDGATGSFGATHATQGSTSAVLPRGVYVIVEDNTTVPAGVAASEPFLLTVPMTDPATTGEGNGLTTWLDEIHVYPKNSKIGGSKTVENADDLVVGDEVTWTILTDIPRIENPAYGEGADQWIAPSKYIVQDTLTDSQLVYVSETITLVRGDGTPFLPEVELAEGVDYVRTLVGGAEAGTTDHTFTLTESGLDKLASAVNTDSNAQVKVELTTKVVASGDIVNDALVTYGRGEYDSPEFNVPSANVKYGDVNVTKRNTDGDLVDDAVFWLYTDKDSAIARADEENRVSTWNLDGNNPVKVDEWTTDGGLFAINGLRYSDFADNETIIDTDDRYVTYWLVEVEAPEGHQILAEPVSFTVTDPLTEIGVEVTNPSNTGGFKLPLTGGQGTALLTIAGVTILGAVLFAARRREDAEAL